MGLDVELRAEACVGSGNCSFWAPEVFDVDDEGLAALLVVPPPEQAVVLAARSCPVEAIVVCRDGEQLAP